MLNLEGQRLILQKIYIKFVEKKNLGGVVPLAMLGNWRTSSQLVHVFWI